MTDTDFNELKTDVKEIKKILVGNGRVGLCEQVRDNKKDSRHNFFCLFKNVFIVVLVCYKTSLLNLTFYDVIHDF